MGTKAGGSFLSTIEIEGFLSAKPPHLAEIALELRNLVAAAAPAASERISWGGLNYYDSRRGGPVRAAICQIEVHPDHVRLSFIHGVHLDDPDHLLAGDRLSKRYIRIDSYEGAQWEAYQRLIAEAARFDVLRTVQG
jgi:hypothetical protein